MCYSMCVIFKDTNKKIKQEDELLEIFEFL